MLFRSIRLYIPAAFRLFGRSTLLYAGILEIDARERAVRLQMFEGSTRELKQSFDSQTTFSSQAYERKMKGQTFSCSLRDRVAQC